MWSDYYDLVDYERRQDKLDKSGSIVYDPSIKLSCRMVSGGESYVVKSNDTSIKYSKEYQIPVMIKEGDRLDGRLVVNVEASKDVFGTFHFCIARVE